MACVLAVMPLAQAAEPASAATRAPSADPAAIDAAIHQAVARYQLPGIAVGVVQGGKVVHRKTLGERVAGSGEPVDADTLFKIASNTKAMTAAVLARLVDAGTLRWDDPVIRHLPDFAMHDPWVTRELQVRDLLIHNSGLGAGAGDLMLWPEPNLFTRHDVIRGLRHLKPIYSFRSRYAYDNTLYIVAGEVAAAAGGKPFSQLLHEELFAPLGMQRCQAGAFALAETGNVAQPHARINGQFVPVRVDPADVPETPMLAAGGVRCSLDAMLQWVRMWLRPHQVGVVGDQPWLSDAQRQAVWAAHTPMPLSQRMRAWDNSHFSAYGYGWRLTDVDGTAKVSHTGTLAGMYSAVTLLPQLDTGFVILINGDAEQARTVLAQVLTKLFTRPGAGLDVAHYADLLEREWSASGAGQGRPHMPPAPDPLATPAELRQWLGVYRDPWFGDADICANGDTVRFRAHKSPKLSGPVRLAAQGPYVDWDDPTVETDAWLRFATDAPGQLRMAKRDPDADFSADFEDLHFQRVGDCALVDASAH